MNKTSVAIVLLFLFVIVTGLLFWNQDEALMKVVKNDSRQEKKTIRIEEELPRLPLLVEVTPAVKADLKPFEFDLTKYYFTDEELLKMAGADRKFDEYGKNHKNGLREFKTSVGTFKVVSSYGRHSIDPNAKNSGGGRLSTIQLPNGKWIVDLLGIEKTLELDKTLYFICRHHVLKWISNEKLECVATFEGVGGTWAPYISLSNTKDGLLAGKYLAVNKSSDSNFGGLLEYIDGKWIFHQYNGGHQYWAVGSEEKDGQLIITLFNNWDHQKGKPAQKIQFDPVKGIFTDL